MKRYALLLMATFILVSVVGCSPKEEKQLPKNTEKFSKQTENISKVVYDNLPKEKQSKIGDTWTAIYCDAILDRNNAEILDDSFYGKSVVLVNYQTKTGNIIIYATKEGNIVGYGTGIVN